MSDIRITLELTLEQTKAIRALGKMSIRTYSLRLEEWDGSFDSDNTVYWVHTVLAQLSQKAEKIVNKSGLMYDFVHGDKTDGS